ncbi:putative Sensor histidine kinase, Cache_1 and HAMP domain-containing [Syntrophobacter sp. SbD1]|nr:putative Sensor histidine kinase, Cache_1 and HAMP domain-containing [Syntrophobacter sp. SbD1]
MYLRFSIARKFIFAFLLLAMMPIVVLGFWTLRSMREIGDSAINSTTAQLESRARESLELRAVESAKRVSQFLQSREADLLTLKMLRRDPEVYLRFSLNHRRDIWVRDLVDGKAGEIHKELPLYKEISFVGADGTEQVRILDDRIIDKSGLRDVGKPENTTFKSERYFEKASVLKPDEISVSHLTGWYVSHERSLRGMTSEGVIRFATPCTDGQGRLEGVIVLSLDHRHLMELTQHILPTEERFAVSPDYSSGNYAFMFDDEGWIIAHPKRSDIRGVLPDGSGFDTGPGPYTRDRLIAGQAPFNLDRASFINPNYSLIAREVRALRSGVTSTFNVGGTQRIMAYAPILYGQPPYDRYGIFGGITIGVETAKFKEPAMLASLRIDEMVAGTKQNSLLILTAAALLAIGLAAALSRTLTRPILYLAQKAEEIASGHIPDEVVVKTGDELEVLADNFAHMARQIRHHQERLERDRNFVESIVTHITNGIITLDAEGKITWFNPYSEAVFGISRNEALGRDYREVFAGLPSWVETIGLCLSSPALEQGPIEYRCVFDSGKEKVLDVHFSTINPERQDKDVFLVIVGDVTHRKLMEEHLRRSDRLISLGVLAAGIAHEIRNPLTGISLLMDDLHDHLHNLPAERELIQKSLQEIDRLENLIDGLLDFAVPSEQIKLEFRPLEEVLQKTGFFVKKLCKNSNISLLVQLEEALPMLRLDAEKLQQALLNLFMNAIQAMPQGGDLRVSVETVAAEDSLLSKSAVRIAVQDTGTGISPEDIPYVFDPFFTRNASGHGLGLAIVHSIVREHGGRISVSSQLLRGTTFWIDLPVV